LEELVFSSVLTQTILNMNIRFFTLALGAWISLFPFNLNAQGFSVYMDTVEVQAGNDVCLAVKAKGFVDIVSFQFSLEWKYQVLKFKEVKHLGLPGWSASDFLSTYSPTQLLIGWANPAGDCFSLPDGDTLFVACFTAIGSVGDVTLITAGGNGFPPGNGTAEAYNCNSQNIWYPEGNDPGLVTIIALSGTSIPEVNKANTFFLYPNPAQASAQVRLSSKNQGMSIIRVSDALGRVVFEQNFPVIFGENNFEIPAKILTAKGMYQVSVQTEQGVSTQMLSVQ